MSRSSCRHSLLAFALGWVLLAPSAFAAGRAGGSAPSWNPWGMFVRLLAASVANLDIGCGLDPHGLCAPAGSPAALDEGCGLDPDGRCAPAASVAHLDEGCGLDPSGLCAPASVPGH